MPVCGSRESWVLCRRSWRPMAGFGRAVGRCDAGAATHTRERSSMKRILLPALALGVMGSTGALAEPMTLTAAQMDHVTAGQFFDVNKKIFGDVRENFQKNVD